MKCQVALLAVLVLATVCELSYAGVSQDRLEELKPLIDICAKESKVDEETLEKFYIDHVIPVSHEGKCFMACMGEHVKLMKDGKFVPEMTTKYVEELVPEKDKADGIKKIINDCMMSIPDTSDKCDKAAGLAQCTKDHHIVLAGMN